jgi:hypothetical protein
MVFSQQSLINEPKVSRHFKHVDKYRRIKRIYAKAYYAKLRSEILKILGNKCVRCGFTDTRALQIDHINGGGSKENRQFGPTRYVMYLKNHCEGLQLLCANCNQIKKHEANEFPFKIEVIG